MCDLAKYIDHTCLKNDTVQKDIKKLCEEAVKYNFKGVCVLPKFVKFARSILKNESPVVISVVDFPIGDKSPDKKAQEAKDLVENGVQEIDMVLDVLALKDKDYSKVFDGIKKVVDIASPIPVKVIIETCYLNHDEKVIACALAQLAKASFVKTSTGFGTSGATFQDVFLMKQIVGNNMSVKASGGVKTKEDALLMIQAGASRIGSSASLDIVKS